MIVADVDNTICDSCQKMSPVMAAEINRLLHKGHTFAFLSGTNKDYLLKMVSAQLEEKHYLLALTGTQCLEVKRGKYLELYKYSLSPREKEEMINALQKLTEKHQIQSLTTREDQIQDRESQITLSAIGRHAPQELKEQFDPDGSKRQRWVDDLYTLLSPRDYEITIAGTTSIDITRKGIDKGWAIQQFARQRQVPLQMILFLGDKTKPGGNDYPATRIVDFVTVENPKDTLEKLKMLFPRT